MKKLLFHLLTFSFFLFSVLFCSRSVFASTEAYKVTDPMHLPAPPMLGVNYVQYYTHVGMNYRGGNVIISRNPDGTGSPDIGDIIQVADVQGEFVYSYPSNSSCAARAPMQPTDISSNFRSHKPYTLLVRLLDACGKEKDISSIYIVVKNIPDPTPTLTLTPTFTPVSTPTLTPLPTATPIPTMTPVPPFLDLPWDYKVKGLSFNDAALSITSYFDHTFPILSIIPALNEAQEFKDEVTTFMDEKSSTKNYSSHDGYDYASSAKVHIGDPVLAAASGTAMYINACAACGNMIEIDHHNGYQTRYMHLQKEGLITTQLGKLVEVTAHEQIGKVGATGHVIPNDERGAHIHFGLVFDKNHNGIFSDDIPDGMSDPFGWQSIQQDPWSIFKFIYQGVQKIGNKSLYLWKIPLDAAKNTVTSTGLVIQNGNFSLSFPAGAVTFDTEVQLNSAPNKVLSDKASIGPTLIATAKTVTGNVVTTFQKAFTITVSFASFDLTPYELKTLSIYSSNDGFTWERQQTTIDMHAKKASAKINHFTHFAVMANFKDLTPPSTTAKYVGNIFFNLHSQTGGNVVLKAKDNKKGLGIDYTLFNLDNVDWETYHSPVKITQPGQHTIQFYSVDKAGNIEDTKQFNFIINRSDSTENNNSDAYHQHYKGS
jgi:murein DD-endopeptidase MepM/ murein hydrolase activator NlpD